MSFRQFRIQLWFIDKYVWKQEKRLIILQYLILTVAVNGLLDTNTALCHIMTFSQLKLFSGTWGINHVAIDFNINTNKMIIITRYKDIFWEKRERGLRFTKHHIQKTSVTWDILLSWDFLTSAFVNIDGIFEDPQCLRLRRIRDVSLNAGKKKVCN